MWALPALALGLDNGLGLTPPMGWSSWNVYAGGVDEAKIVGTIRAMAGLAPFGYEYVNIGAVPSGLRCRRPS